MTVNHLNSRHSVVVVLAVTESYTCVFKIGCTCTKIQIFHGVGDMTIVYESLGVMPLGVHSKAGIPINMEHYTGRPVK